MNVLLIRNHPGLQIVYQYLDSNTSILSGENSIIPGLHRFVLVKLILPH